MRYAANHKRKTRERILAAAAGLFRRRGYAATGVDAVMASAKLTAGGFYGHFRSKRALLAKALDAAFRESRNGWPERLKSLGGRAWAQALVSFYLSREHRDALGGGCPIPALAPEIARSGDAVRSVFQQHLEGLVETAARHMGHSEEDRAHAISAIALMAGGLMLSRAVKDRAFADEILDACRNSMAENCRS